MRMVAIRDLVTVRGGGTPRKSVPDYFGGNVPWVTPKDMKRWLVESSEITLTEAGVANSPAKPIPAGAVLVVVRSGVLKHTLPVALATRDVTVNQDMKALIPTDELHGAYLARLLKARQPEILSWVRATTADNFSIDNLLDMRVTLPSLAEQRRVAAILDHADALRAKRRRSLALLDHLGSSIFGFLYGDPTTPHPTTRPLAEVARLQIGPFGSLLHKSDYTVAGIPLINPMHIVDGELRPDPRHSVSEAKASELEIYRLRRGDVVMGRRGEMGRCAIVTASQEGMLCGTGSLIVRPDLNSVTSQYLQAVLSYASVKRQLERQALGATLPNLNAGIVNAVRMRVPPLSEQAYLEEVADSISRKTSVARRSLATLDEFFTSLQSRAFSGGLTLSAS